MPPRRCCRLPAGRPTHGLSAERIRTARALERVHSTLIDEGVDLFGDFPVFRLPPDVIRPSRIGLGYRDSIHFFSHADICFFKHSINRLAISGIGLNPLESSGNNQLSNPRRLMPIRADSASRVSPISFIASRRKSCCDLAVGLTAFLGVFCLIQSGPPRSGSALLPPPPGKLTQ